MDDIQEVYHKLYGTLALKSDYSVFELGYKASNPLPTEKVCPECLGLKEVWEAHPRQTSPEHCIKIKCPKCKDKGKIPLYYTPEDYLRITGKVFSDEALVWVFTSEWEVVKLKSYPYIHDIFYIVQTNQGAPEADYRSKV